MRALQTAAIVAMGLVLVGCVTINVYFPQAAAEQAADRVIQDVLGREGRAPADESPKQQPSGDTEATPPGTGLLPELLFWAVPVAHAEEPRIDIKTPAIERIKASMRARTSELRPYFQNGAIGMTNDGKVAIRDAAQIPLKDRGRVKRLVAEENRDRDALYREIAQANGHPEWESKFREIFAERWVKNIPSGWWYQTASGDWKQK